MARLTRVAPRPHHHRESPSKTVEGPFFGPVAQGAHQNRAAHGNITQHQTCSCGMGRRVLVNGHHRELGPWLGEVVR